MSSSDQTSEEVVYEGKGITWTDTRAMEWASFPGLGVGKAKFLHVDGDGNPLVFLVWLPPGDMNLETPHRHYHATTFENAYITEGDLPHAEWASADSDDHDIVVFRKGYFMDRKPGSIHGLDNIFSETGNVILFWRDRIGNWLDEPNADVETLEVPFNGTFKGKTRADALQAKWDDGVVIERPDLKILDTREMPWEPMTNLTGAKVKVLARDDDGNPKVQLVHIPPGELPTISLPERHFHKTVHEWGMMIEGEMPIWEYEDADQQEGTLVTLKPGYFMNRKPGSIHGIEIGSTSPTGAIFLEWRTGPGTFLEEPLAEGETFSVPYGDAG